MYPGGALHVNIGNQYFDLDVMTVDSDGEVFVDVGCYDGLSSVGAAKWSGGMLKRVIAFEADKNNIEICERNISQIGCEYQLLNRASWDKPASLRFHSAHSMRYASSVDESGDIAVEAESIDNVLSGEKETFIKLDVEGSELRTLKGAINTIKRHRPKMAISVYHKSEDIVEIPVFMESLGMDYKYYIRQYQNREYETILYAI